MGSRIVLFVILIIGFLVKLPALDLPLVGYFGSYQVMTAMMADLMDFRSLGSVLVPRTYVLLQGEPALHLLNYPLGGLVAAGLRAVFDGNLDFWGHFQSAAFILLAAVALYFVAKRFYGEKVALLSCFVFSFSPMVLLSGVTFQNEGVALLLLVLSFCLLGSASTGAGFSSGILFSMSLVARLHFAACLPAFLLYLCLERRSIKQFLWFGLGAMIPVAAWFGFVWYVDRTHGNVMTSLFSQLGEGRVLLHPLIRTREFYERIWEILTGPWLTPLALPFLIMGLFDRDRKTAVIVVWCLFSLMTIGILPQKVFDHPFYLIHSLPAASILIAKALERLSPLIPGIARMGLVVAYLAASFRYYLPSAFLSRTDGPRIESIGRRIQELTGPEDRLIASYGSSAGLLYYSQRWGWPFNLGMAENQFRDRQERHQRKRAKGYGDPIVWLEHLREEGGSYFVTAEPETFYAQKEFAAYLSRTYTPVQLADPSFLMFELKKAVVPSQGPEVTEEAGVV